MTGSRAAGHGPPAARPESSAPAGAAAGIPCTRTVERGLEGSRRTVSRARAKWPAVASAKASTIRDDSHVEASRLKRASYTHEDLIACAQGTLFGADTARLPAAPMLMFDRIATIRDEGGAHGRGEVRAELDVTPSLWFFQCHFHDDPVMPGCLGLDAMWQLVGFYLAWSGHKGRGRALGVGEVKFFGQVLPEARLVTYQIDMRRVIARSLVLGIADGSMSVDGRTIYTARDLRVGLFDSLDRLSG